MQAMCWYVLDVESVTFVCSIIWLVASDESISDSDRAGQLYNNSLLNDWLLEPDDTMSYLETVVILDMFAAHARALVCT